MIRRSAKFLRRLVSWQAFFRLLLLSLTLTLGIGFWLVGTESGSRFTIVWISGLVPDFKVQYKGGTLLGPLQLRTIVFKGKTRVDIDDIALDWSPGALLLGELHLTGMHVASVKIVQPPAAANAPRHAFALRDLQPPLDLRIDRLTVDRLDIARGERVTHYSELALDAEWQDTQLRVTRLVAGMPHWEATLQGTLQTAGDWPLDAQLRYAYAVPRHATPTFLLQGTARGPLAQVHMQLTSSGFVASRIDGNVALQQPGFPFTATLQADSVHIPSHAPAAGQADHRATVSLLRLQGGGELTGDFRLAGNAQFATPWTKTVPVQLHAAGSWRGLERAEIVFSDPRFDATLVSDYRWLNGQQFDARLEIRHLDLVLTNPALHSDLAGSVQIAGKLPPAPADGVPAPSPRFDLQIDNLSGPLLQRAVRIDGPLYWQDGFWTFADLNLRQGNNLAVLRGTLGNEWDADATLTLGDLHTLVPAFTGRGNGSAHLHGAPADPHFAYALQTQELGLPVVTLPAPANAKLALPPADWNVRGDATLRDARLDEAYTVDAAFSMRAQGQVGWAPQTRWDLDTQLDGLAPARVAPSLFSAYDGDTLQGSLRTQGVLRAADQGGLQSLTIDTRLDGRYAAQPLHADAAFDWTAAQLQVQRLQLDHGENHLRADGLLGHEKIALALDVDAPRLGDSLREVDGRLQGSAKIGGTRTHPDAALQLNAGALSWREFALQELQTALQLADGAYGDSHLQLTLRGLDRSTPGNTNTGSGNNTRRIDRFVVAADGRRDAHRLDLQLDSGPLRIAFDLAGAAADGNWQGRLQHGQFEINRWQWTAVGEPGVALHDLLQAPHTQLQLDAHCWTDSSARLCFTAPAVIGRDGTLALEAFHLPLEALLGDLLPLDTLLRGNVGATLAARWADGTPTFIAADLRNEEALNIARLGDSEDEQRDIARIEQLNAGLQLADGRLHAQTLLAGADAGHLEATLDATHVGSDLTAIALQGRARVEKLQLALLEAFSYQIHQVGGTLDSTLEVGGTAGVPHLHGTLQLRDGRLAFTRLPLALDHFTLDGSFDDNRLAFDGSFHTPESPENAHLAGQAQFTHDDWRASADLTGKRIAVAMLPEYQFLLSPQLHLQANRDAVVVSGDVQVPEGRIEIKRLPVQSVRRSHDVVVVHGATAADDSSGGLGIRQRVDIHFLLGDDIRFRAFGGEGRLTGDLRVRSTPELPLLIDGELHVQDGKYRALGQLLALKQADVIFNGPADQPLIDALAVRSINDAAVREVGLRLSGSLRAPQTVIWSSPDMPPEEALSWLTTGHAPTGSPLNLRGEATSAAIGLGAAQGSALLSQAGQEIGLQDVQLSASGEGDTAEVQVGTNVNERVFVGYNRRVFTGEGSVLLRLQMTRRLMLEALSGVESALDLFYTFEF